MPKLILGICKYSDSGYYKIVQSYSYIWCNKQNMLFRQGWERHMFTRILFKTEILKVCVFVCVCK